MSDNKKMIKFYCKMDALDYKGKVVTFTRTVDVQWHDYDPSMFMNNTLLSGDVSENPSPIGNDYNYFPDHYFHIDTWDINDRNIVIESEIVQNMKFVVIDTKNNIKGKWVEV